MWTKTAVGDRFQKVRRVASGGMGSIFRALDRTTGSPVAIKVIDGLDPERARRFQQEADLLSGLRHPAVVRYVTHGSTLTGEPYLVMEWLEGEDLATRLRREVLAVEETRVLLRRVAEGLRCAHERGIVHRDLKPSNIFLCADDVAQAKLLDFGIARFGPQATTLTREDSIMGTIGYMAPEQALAAQEVDARTDLFALGCVLFECLTGQPPFAGKDAVAVLAKVLREDPPSLRELRPDVSGMVASLIDWMLQKDPEARPADAAALLDALDTMSSKEALERRDSAPSAPSGLTGAEQRIASVMLLAPQVDRNAAYTGDGTMISAHTASEESELARVTADLQRLGADVAELADGTILVSASSGQAVDTLEHIATSALSLQHGTKKWRVALATGRTAPSGRSRLGPVIDRAVALLQSEATAAEPADATTEDSAGPSSAPPSSGLIVDEVTAALLGRPFVERKRTGVRVVLGAHEAARGSSAPLRRSLPLIGRRRELSMLEATLAECVEDSVARTVLVTGSPGIGKSRLAREFLESAKARARILRARADPVASGAPFMLAGSLVREAAGLTELSAKAGPAKELSRYLGRYFEGETLARVTTFLCQLIGVEPLAPFAPEYHAAKEEPRIMAEWVRRSFEEWLAAEVRSQALVIVLDDLHWADSPSTELIGETSRKLRDRPLVVLGLARSGEAGGARIWSGRDKLSIEIEPLTKRAAERLVQAAVGTELEQESVDAIVERAEGNPFFLEELVRAALAGQLDDLPETVLAVLEARLSDLEPEARRLLRAASIFGERFDEERVLALLSGPGAAFDPQWFVVLSDREIIQPSEGGRASSREYRFRHSLVRDAAYAMLPATDRKMGHQLAGAWLEQSGYADPLVIAEHYYLADQKQTALVYFVRAAEAAYRATNMDQAVMLAERGLACGATGEDRGLLRAIEAWAVTWTGRWRQVNRLAKEAVELLSRSSAHWFRAATTFVYSGASLGQAPSTIPVLETLLALPSQPSLTGPYGEALMLLAAACCELGDRKIAVELLEPFAAVEDPRNASDVAFSAWLELARAHCEVRSDLPGSALRRVTCAAEAFDRLGDGLGQTMAAFYEGAVCFELGRIEQAEGSARRLLSSSRRHGLSQMTRWGKLNLGSSFMLAGRAQEALETVQPLQNLDDQLIAPNARMLAAGARRGSPEEMESRALALLEETFVPNVHMSAHGMIARLALRRGDVEGAYDHAAAGLELHRDHGGASRVASLLRLIRIEALRAMGKTDAAADELVIARDRIVAIGEDIDDEALCASYMNAVEVNAHTLRLAREVLG